MEHTNDSMFISKAEIVGSCIINKFCNIIYKNACNVSLNKKTQLSLTDIYRTIIYDYLKNVDKNIDSEIDSITTYFRSTTKHMTMTANECVEFILIDFIPSSLNKDITFKKKKTLLTEILINTLKNFSEVLINKYIKFILHDRNNKDYIGNLQQEFISIFTLEKDKFYNKCINPNPNNKMIPNEMFIKIQEKLKLLKNNNAKLTNEKKTLIEDNKKLFNMIQTLKNQIDIINNNLKEVNETNIKYTQQIKQLKAKIDILNNTIQDSHKRNEQIKQKEREEEEERMKEIEEVIKEEIIKEESEEETEDVLESSDDEFNNSIIEIENKKPVDKMNIFAKKENNFIKPGGVVFDDDDTVI